MKDSQRNAIHAPLSKTDLRLTGLRAARVQEAPKLDPDDIQPEEVEAILFTVELFEETELDLA